MSRALYALMASLMVIALLAGCGGQSSPSASAPASTSAKASSSSSPSASAKPPAKDPMEEMVVDAKKEGKVVVYASWSDAQGGPVRDAFAKKYPGISVEFMPMTGAEAVPRIQQEQSAQKYVADLYLTGSPAVRQATALGFVEKWEPPAAKEPGVQYLVDPFTDGDGPVIHMVDGQFIIVNTNLVKAGEEPKSWKDLEDPKWKGKILLSNPGTSGPGNRWFTTLYQAYGEAHVRKIIENSVIYKGDFSGQATEIARGEYAVTIPTVASTFGPFIKEGAPLKVIDPTDGVFFLLSQTALIKHAPHPNAAKLLFNFLFTKEGQAAIADIGGTPIRKDVDPVFKEFKVTKVFPGQPPSKEWEAKDYVQTRPIAQKIMQELGK